MIPDHCRHVSVHKVDHDLNPEKIKQELLVSNIYKGTEYLILNNKNDWSVVRVEKTPRRGLFWMVTGVKIISHPQETIYIENPEIDVLNKNMMAQVADEHPGKVVVVKGSFGHVSFVTAESAIDLLVLEVIPPTPPKLITLVKNLLKVKSFAKPIKIKEKIIDIASFIEKQKSEIIIFPCNASGLAPKREILYLDEKPKLDSENGKDVTLIGCELSLKIFKELYNFEPGFINICPAKLAENFTKKFRVLVKCCKPKGFECRENLYLVPWGVTYDDLEEVFNELTK